MSLKKYLIALILCFAAIDSSVLANTQQFIKAEVTGIGSFQLSKTLKEWRAELRSEQDLSLDIVYNTQEIYQRLREPGLYFLSALKRGNEEFNNPREFALANFCSDGATFYANDVNLLNMKSSGFITFYDSTGNDQSDELSNRLRIISIEFITSDFSKKVGDLLSEKYGSPPVIKTTEEGDCSRKENELFTQEWVNTAQNFSVTLEKEIEYDESCQIKEPDYTIHYKDHNLFEKQKSCDIEMKRKVLSNMNENKVISKEELLDQL